MGKKNRDQEPAANLNSVANRDIIQRINFLYQASTYLNSVSQPSPGPSVNPQPKTVRSGRKKKNTIRHPKDTAELSRCYVGSMRIVGQKTMIRMDPSMKRTLCKQCDTVLIPGSTASTRIKPSGSHGHAVVYTCLSCNTSRRIPAPPVLNMGTPSLEEGDTAPPSVANASTHNFDPTATEAMVVDEPAQGLLAPKVRKRHRRTKPKPVARAPPFFEREGHVTFQGNEKFTER